MRRSHAFALGHAKHPRICGETLAQVSGLSPTAGAHVEGLQPDSRKEETKGGLDAYVMCECVNQGLAAPKPLARPKVRPFATGKAFSPFRMICGCYRTTNTGTLPSARTSDV